MKSTGCSRCSDLMLLISLALLGLSVSTTIMTWVNQTNAAVGCEVAASQPSQQAMLAPLTGLAGLYHRSNKVQSSTQILILSNSRHQSAGHVWQSNKLGDKNIGKGRPISKVCLKPLVLHDVFSWPWMVGCYASAGIQLPLLLISCCRCGGWSVSRTFGAAVSLFPRSAPNVISWRCRHCYFCF